eukprot:1399409-Alexandrium_andersonii.AAC.1
MVLFFFLDCIQAPDGDDIVLGGTGPAPSTRYSLAVGRDWARTECDGRDWARTEGSLLDGRHGCFDGNSTQLC